MACANDQAIAMVESQAGDSLVGPSCAGQTYNRVTIETGGGPVLPLRIDFTFDDRSKELVKLPSARQMPLFRVTSRG